MAEDPAAYEEIQDSTWAAEVAKLGWTTSTQFPGLVLRGSCPNCHHDGAINAFVITEGTTFLKGKAPESAPRELVACQCSQKHPGAPDKPLAGCGRWGYVAVVAPKSG